MSSIHGVNVGGNLFDVSDSSNVAPYEPSDFASRDYAKNRCMLKADGLLYRAMVDIDSGDPLVINSNIKRTTLDAIIAGIETDSDLIAPTEDGPTSSDEYVIGEQIVRSGILYKVIDDIAEGDAFSVGGNIALAGTLTSQIQTLANGLSTETTNRENADSAIDYVISENGAKNLYEVRQKTQTISGISFTVYDDGRVLVNTNGVVEADVNFELDTSDKQTLSAGEFTLSGRPSDAAYSKLTYLYNDGTWKTADDVGQGVNFTLSGSETMAWMRLTILAGANFIKEFRPMITLASQPNSDYAHYVPYAKTNRELTDDLKVKEYSFTTSYTADAYTKLSKTGRICSFTFRTTITSALAAYAVIAKVPSEAIPQTVTEIFGEIGSNIAPFVVDGNGNIYCRQAIAQNSLIYLSTTYITNQ